MADAAKIERTTAKTKFTRTEKSLSNALTSDGIMLDTMTRRFSEFRIAYTQCETKHDAYILALGDDVEDNEEEWLTGIITRFETLEIRYDTKVKELSAPVLPPPPVAPTIVQTTPPRENSMFKHDKMKFPPFDGNIRKYAKWKEEYEIHVQPLCAPTQSAFILKTHLCDELREEMDILGGDETEIWERLDQRFGNKSRLVDTILADVKGVQKCTDDSSTLKMIKTIERCYNELKSTRRETEMNNTTIISMIEEKMSLEMSTEWIKAITKKDADHEDKFSLLKALLDDWRARIEYKIANLRASTTTEEGTVFFGNSSTNNSNNNNNTTRTQQQPCWMIHTSNNNHPIWRCREFQKKSVDERIALVRENNACFKCLSKGHNTAACTKTFKCTVQNCNQYHNKLLHKEDVISTNANNSQQQQQHQQQSQPQQQQQQQQM